MTGGLGADIFGIGETTTDFSRAQGGKMNFLSLVTNPVFVGYVGYSAAAAGPEIQVVAGAGFQSVQIDYNGDRVTD